MSKEVTKLSSEVSKEVMEMSWGESPLETSDFIIPKVLLMQKNSTLLKEKGYNEADFVNSATKEVIKEISFIPFKLEKLWIVKKKIGNKSEFVRQEVWNTSNNKRQTEFKEGRDTLTCQKTWRFYGLINEEQTPYIIDMRGMSYKTGQLLANVMFLKNKLNTLPEHKTPASTTVEITTGVDDLDGAESYVFTLGKQTKTSIETLKVANQWSQSLASMDFKVDSDEEETPSQQKAPAESSAPFTQDEIPF